ncbi:serine protease 40-like [Contarinia nasturtii]|uniref:serine protease 40-like n=1 Tax=Contarinia nasturtii TaxID=265458 RepID=UPI0012D3EB85|nr:serine protease 40-like [Contarinia nasturtii]
MAVMRILKLKEVNIIQLFILMVVCSGYCIPTNNSSDCVIVGSHEYISENDLISWGKERTYTLPWEVRVLDPGCKAILISNKHVLARTSCIFQGIDPTTFHSDGTSNELSLPHTKVLITNSYAIKVHKIYVHKSYNNWTRDGDISILELSESVFLLRNYIYPAVLPQAPLDLHHGKLYVAFNEGDSSHSTFLQKVNASIWSNDECAPDLDHKIVIKENLLCIEVTDACDHLLNDTYNPYEGPLYHVLKNGSMEIIGIPKGVRCKYDYMESTDSMITKSALVYTRLVDFLPWIQNILNIGCGDRTIHFGNNLDAFVFKVDMKQTEKQWPRKTHPILCLIVKLRQPQVKQYKANDYFSFLRTKQLGVISKIDCL